MASLWQDPRTGVWKLRRRIPARYRKVAAQRGDTVKISTGTADRKAAERALPTVLAQWEEMLAEWERRLHVVDLTPENAAEVASKWAVWAATSGTIRGDGAASDVFEPLAFPEARTPDRMSAMWEVVGQHADAALALAGISTTPSGREHLLAAMVQPVAGAYTQADLGALGVSLGPSRSNDAVPVGVRPPIAAATPTPPAPVPLEDLFEAWKMVAVVKPRVVSETRYAILALRRFVGHEDAARITREDLLGWRRDLLEGGAGNNTWNNRLSLVRQVFLRAVSDGRLVNDPTVNLRLPKARQKSPRPYSDADAVSILQAARREASPSLRWAHWIMAFSGMRAGEVLQLLGRDVRQEGDVWIFDVNEDEPTKSVKTSERRNVPVHPALVREGFLDYVRTVQPGAPVFPDKGLDPHGKRGGRAWNLIGKWVRGVVGLKDPDKAPDHSWRHRVEDELRAAEVPEYLRDAIMGHARRTTGRRYGVRGEALVTLAQNLAKVQAPAGLFPGEAPHQG